jgi:hypothetical protein
MIRGFAVACALFALCVFVGGGEAGAQAKKNQMVKGTIKLVDTSKDLLVINQKVKNETVDRELSILDTTEFAVTIGGETKEVSGKQGLKLLEGRTGAQVQVKCDKDVNVLKVTVKAK